MYEEDDDRLHVGQLVQALAADEADAAEEIMGKHEEIMSIDYLGSDVHDEATERAGLRVHTFQVTKVDE